MNRVHVISVVLGAAAAAAGLVSFHGLPASRTDCPAKGGSQSPPTARVPASLRVRGEVHPVTANSRAGRDGTRSAIRDLADPDPERRTEALLAYGNAFAGRSAQCRQLLRILLDDGVGGCGLPEAAREFLLRLASTWAEKMRGHLVPAMAQVSEADPSARFRALRALYQIGSPPHALVPAALAAMDTYPNDAQLHAVLVSLFSGGSKIGEAALKWALRIEAAPQAENPLGAIISQWRFRYVAQAAVQHLGPDQRRACLSWANAWIARATTEAQREKRVGARALNLSHLLGTESSDGGAQMARAVNSGDASLIRPILQELTWEGVRPRAPALGAALRNVVRNGPDSLVVLALDALEGEPDLEPFLLGLLEHASQRKRLAAAALLARRGKAPQSFLDRAWTWLATGTPEQRRIALRALNRHSQFESRHAEVLVETSRTDGCWEPAIEALEALEQAFRGTLLPLCEHPDDRTRVAAFEAIQSMEELDPQYLPSLRRGLQDNTLDVRRRAAIALVHRMPDEYAPSLPGLYLQIWREGFAIESDLARQAIGRLGHLARELLPDLVALYERKHADKDEDGRRAMAWIIGRVLERDASVCLRWCDEGDARRDLALDVMFQGRASAIDAIQSALAPGASAGQRDTALEALKDWLMFRVSKKDVSLHGRCVSLAQDLVRRADPAARLEGAFLLRYVDGQADLATETFLAEMAGADLAHARRAANWLCVDGATPQQRARYFTFADHADAKIRAAVRRARRAYRLGQ